MPTSFTLTNTHIPNLLPPHSRSHDIPHLSEIIHYLCLENGHYALQSDDDTTHLTRMQLGLTLEYALMQRYALDAPNRFMTTGEIRCEGIALTPDLVDILYPSIIDIKLTWSRNGNPKSLRWWKWWTQVLCYAYAVSRVFGMTIRTVEIWVCFVNGVTVAELKPGEVDSLPDLDISQHYGLTTNYPTLLQYQMGVSGEEIRGRWELIQVTSRSAGFLKWWGERHVKGELKNGN